MWLLPYVLNRAWESASMVWAGMGQNDAESMLMI